MGKPQWRRGWEARKYGGWRNKGTRLADFGMVEYCQLVKRILLTEGQEVGKMIHKIFK
jgi:hypothetical protein